MSEAANTSIQAPRPAPAGYEYAGFSRRALALTIDQLILLVITLLLVIPGTILLGLGTLIAWPFVFMIFTPPVLPVTTIISWLYFASQESSYAQATFGKRLCGMRVTDMQGSRISFGRASGRFFGKFLSSAIMMIGWIMAAFTERHQALHDLLAETLVLKRVK